MASAELGTCVSAPQIGSQGLLEVDNSLLYHKLRDAFAEKQFFIPEGTKWPTANLSSRSKSLNAVAQLKPDPAEACSFTDQQIGEWQKRMAEAVMAMDDLTADVLDFICAAWLREAHHPEAMVTVTADDFLRLRALKPQKGGSGRRGGFKDELRRKVAKQIDVLSSTWITVLEMETVEIAQGKRGPFRKRTRWQGESMALVVSSRFGEVVSQGAVEAYIWRVRPGDVFARFLFGPGRQTALLSQKALEYDPYRQKWEKRLARYLAWQWRNRQGTGNYLHPFRVQTLLDAVQASVSPLHPLRTRKRLEEALDVLEKDGVIESWQYEPTTEENIGQRGWWKEWLGWKVVIEPPQAVVDHYAAIRAPGAKRKGLPPKAGNIGQAVKRARLERGLTQLQAAEQMGINQATLSRIERGQKPDPKTLGSVKRWLAKAKALNRHDDTGFNA